MPEPTARACDVCVLLDANHEPKRCTFCSLCGAWLCERCASDWLRRMRAAAKAMAAWRQTQEPSAAQGYEREGE